MTDISGQESSVLLGMNGLAVSAGAGRVGLHHSLPSKKKAQSSEVKSSICRRRYTQFTTDAAVEEF